MDFSKWFYNQQNSTKPAKNKTALKLFFSVNFNPPEKADSCVHQNTASCVFSCLKYFPQLKTTCPYRGQKKTPKSFFS
jgi:hypothetical protein